MISIREHLKMKTLHCPACGKPTSTEATFCRNCGCPLENNMGNPSSMGNQSQATQRFSHNCDNVIGNRNNHSTANKWLIACIALVAIVGTIVVVVMLGGKNDVSSQVSKNEYDILKEEPEYPEKQDYSSELKGSDGHLNENDKAEALDVLNRWNDTHNSRDYSAMEELYAPQVHFYTADMSAGDVISSIQQAVAGSSWVQEISGTPIVTRLSGNKLKISFDKHTNSEKGDNTYPSYLILEKIDGRWLIVHESDEITDFNVRKKKNK